MTPAVAGGDLCPVCGAPWPQGLGPPVDVLVGTAAPCAPVDRAHQLMLLCQHSCDHRRAAFLDARGAAEVERLAKVLLVLCALYPRGSRERRQAEMAATAVKRWQGRR